MQQVFIDSSMIADGLATITGEDANHLGRVLRIRPGEEIRISSSDGQDYFAEILEASPSQVTAKIMGQADSTELNNKIYLFQAVPKGDRMETVIEKAVELGVYEIIPVEMKYCVVKLDDKKKAKRLQRWQTIAETAARQSKRSRIPQVHDFMTYRQAVAYAKETCQVNLVPYENERGMVATTEALNKIKDDVSVSIHIGPEGGFAEDEIEMVREDMDVISLGKRILRTDTAAITTMSMVMLHAETVAEQ